MFSITCHQQTPENCSPHETCRRPCPTAGPTPPPKGGARSHLPLDPSCPPVGLPGPVRLLGGEGGGGVTGGLGKGLHEPQVSGFRHQPEHPWTVLFQILQPVLCDERSRNSPAREEVQGLAERDPASCPLCDSEPPGPRGPLYLLAPGFPSSSLNSPPPWPLSGLCVQLDQKTVAAHP